MTIDFKKSFTVEVRTLEAIDASRYSQSQEDQKMTLASHRLLALDSSTLGIIAKDYWSEKPGERLKAKTFTSELRDRGVFVTFTITHVAELLRHENTNVARKRLRFLNELPLMAWLRPFDGQWFPGTMVDLLMRELATYRTGTANSWREIVSKVRDDLWETGIGAEMFVNDPQLWAMIRSQAQQQHAEQIYVASVGRSQAGGLSKLTIAQARRSPKRTPQDVASYLPRFAAEMIQKLKLHGDARLNQPREIATDFASNTLKRLQSLDSSKGDFIDQLIERSGVPMELITPSTTLEEIGELSVYVQRLKQLGELLRPPCTVSMVETPINTLPAYVLERRLRAIQQKAMRVNGSDVGDGHLAVLVLYTDGIQVDKRTHQYLEEIKRSVPELGNLMCPFFKEANYTKILERFP